MKLVGQIIKAICCVIPHRPTRHKARKILTNSLVHFGVIYPQCDLLTGGFCEFNQLIQPQDRCLVVAPHPDDEVIGCGGIMAKYKGQFDCVVLNSSGVAYKNDRKTAEEIADERIAEFYAVMDFLEVRNRFIFKIFGPAPHFQQMLDMMPQYLKTLDLTQYKYIFVPDRLDGHREHRFVTNYLIPHIMKCLGGGYNRKGYVCQYNVWGTVTDPNYFEDISNVIKVKEQAILKYLSRTQIPDNYAKRMAGLNYFYGLLMGVNRGIQAVEVYHIETTRQYLSHRDDKSWAKII